MDNDGLLPLLIPINLKVNRLLLNSFALHAKEQKKSIYHQKKHEDTVNDDDDASPSTIKC
ncbi:hypothetical protein I4U23_000571 [Adineta vaga]|nr:hypothetical protein I4U23_000571 [Adineta vaga]